MQNPMNARFCQLLACSLLLIAFPSTLTAQPACPDESPDQLLERVYEGEFGPLGRHLSAQLQLQENPRSSGWLGTVTLELDLAAWREQDRPQDMALCLAIVLETEEGLQVADRRKITVSHSASRGWTFQHQLELPETTSQALVLVQHPTSGSWGAGLAAENEDPAPRPGPGAVRLDTATWYESPGSDQPTDARETNVSRAATVIRLVPPRQQPVSGSTRFQSLISSDAVERVEFFVDGQKVDESKRRPFSARLLLASPPRPQIVRAVAYDGLGKPFGEDALTVNQLDAPFRVKIARIDGDPASGQIEVTAEVAVPPDAELRAVEFYRNEERIVSRTAPPFRAKIPTADLSPTDFLRVAAFLTDGSSIDDAMLLAAPGAVEEVEVNLVELQIVVTDAAGQPVEDLGQDDFAVVLEGEARPIESFAYADDVPLILGVVVDTSGSMRLLMHDTRQAAAKFLGSTVLPQDSAFVVDFDERPHLLQPVTDDMTALLLSLSRLDAQGTTALYDAVVFSMLQFENQAGRKALVVLSDGDDRDSRFGPRECVDYGHQQGVPIYVIGLGELDTFQRTYPKKELRKITGDTGGRLYFVDSFSELDGAYAQIGRELRSQYTLTFYTDRDLSNEEMRAVIVRVDRPGVDVRTVVGVRPKN